MSNMISKSDNNKNIEIEYSGFIGEIKVLVVFQHLNDKWEDKILTLNYDRELELVDFDIFNSSDYFMEQLKINLVELLEQIQLDTSYQTLKSKKIAILKNVGVNHFLIFKDGELDWK